MAAPSAFGVAAGLVHRAVIAHLGRAHGGVGQMTDDRRPMAAVHGRPSSVIHGDDSVFQGLPQYLQPVLAELRHLVQEQHPAVRSAEPQLSH